MSRRRRMHCLVPVLFVAGLVYASAASVAAASSDRVVFLTLRLQNDTVSVLHWQVVLGKLKAQRGPTTRSGIHFEALAADGKVVWRDEVSDPSIQRFEYEDPAVPTRLMVKIIKVDSSQFVVRVPLDPSIDRVSFFRGDATAASDRIGAPNVRHDLGVIKWPPAGEKK